MTNTSDKANARPGGSSTTPKQKGGWPREGMIIATCSPLS